MNITRALLATALAAACGGIPAYAAQPAAACSPTVNDGWVRLPPMAMPMLAGFGRIANPCDDAVTIVAATSPGFGEVSIHETRIEAGVSKMRAIPSIRIEPGQSAELKPGGLHLMLMHPVAPLAAGTSVPVEFRLDDGRVLRSQFQARAPGQ